MLASRAFRQAPHAVIYVHCAKLREVDTTAVLHEAMEQRKRCGGVPAGGPGCLTTQFVRLGEA